MQMIQKSKLNYYFKDESVTLEVVSSGRLGNTYVSFNCYSLQSRTKFKQFRQTLIDSEPKEYNSINDAYGLARQYDIRATNGHRPTIIDTIAF